MSIAELITRALQLAGVVGMNRTPSADEMTDGLDTLNDMLQAWTLDGMDLGLSALETSDEDLLDPAYIRGIRYSLAVELASAHGILNELPDYVVGLADSEQDKIRAALADIDYARVDPALLNGRISFNHTTGQ